MTLAQLSVALLVLLIASTFALTFHAVSAVDELAVRVAGILAPVLDAISGVVS